jgi:nucleoid-associated protein YgaU
MPNNASQETAPHWLAGTRVSPRREARRCRERSAADQTPLPASDQDGDQQTVEYTVQPGDSLWALAERFYGSGERWPELFAANRHRPQPDGRRLEDERRIYPGWILRVPVPNRVVEREDGALHYVVRPGDTLRGIAGRLLGDEARWSKIFELNRGTASLPAGRVLTDPDLIWPDLRLRLPLPAHADAPRPALAAEAPAAPAAAAIRSASAALAASGFSQSTCLPA